MNKLALILIVTLFIIPFVFAETYPQHSDVLVSHPIRINGAVSSIAEVNISIRDPIGSFLINSQGMGFNASTQENEFLLAGGNTTKVGIYPYCITATGSGLNNTECFNFEITPSGFSRISTGEGIITFGGLLIMFSIGIFGLLLFLKSDSFAGKITFISIAGIFILMTILFSTVLIQQNLGGFDNILSGYDTFVFVVKSVVTVSFLSFGIFIFIFMVKAWKIKQGRFE